MGEEVDTGIYWLIYLSLPVTAPNRDALEAGIVYKPPTAKNLRAIARVEVIEEIGRP